MAYTNALILDRNFERYEALAPLWSKYNIIPKRVETMTDALQEIQSSCYHLIVLMEASGSTEALDAIPLFRGLTHAPLVVASDEEQDSSYKVKAFDAGADEVWRMPDTFEEVVAKGRAMIRRALEYSKKMPTQPTIISNGEVVISTDQRLIFVCGKLVKVPRKEYEILKMLIASPRRVFTYEQIYREVWGEEYADSANSILWGHIKQLRREMQVEPGLPQFIKTVHGVGYSYDPE